MSDRVVQSYDNSNRMTGKAAHPYQSAWMAHWMRTSCKSANRGCSQLSVCYESHEDNHDARQHHLLSGTEIVDSSSKYAKGFSEVNKGKTVNISNESPMSSSERLRSDRSDFQPLPVCGLPQKGESFVAEKIGQASISHLRSQIDLDSRYYPFSLSRGDRYPFSMLARSPPDPDTSSRECHFQPEQLAKYDKFIESKRKVLEDDFVGSTSKIVPHGCNHRAPMQSQEKINKINSILVSEDEATNTNYPSNSMILVHEKTINMARRSTNSLSRHNDVALPHDISKSIQQPHFLGKQRQRIPDCSGNGLFPSRSISSGLHGAKKLYLGRSSLPSLPCDLYNMEDLRICSTVNSMEDSARGQTKFSQTTHHFMFAKKTNFDLCEGGPMLKESSLPTKLKGSTFTELFSLCPDNEFPVQPGVKLQLLGSSASSEGEKDAKDFNTSAANLNNESSADTDTMDMDIFRENRVSGMASSPTNKCIELDPQSPTSQPVFPSTEEETRNNRVKTNLPDINQELPDLAAYGDDKETSTSKTQSLDVEHLLSHAVQPKRLKSSARSDSYLEQEPSSIWVKRLKLSPTSACGTKSSEMAEASSHEKVNKFFSKIMNRSINNSEPPMGTCEGKEQTIRNQTAFLLRNSESSPIESKRENQDIKISHPWIQRWCRNVAVAPPKKSKAVEFFEPQCLKVMSNEVQQKHFPSLAAMALMGKAMTGFRPCEFTKKGGLVVWNCK
ncbi:hypothetical protein FEM48_Zijuj09G0102500 [Ziziphus jujuba var. spinosa]|uniref:F-box protein At2g16365-like n=1 Tax=Ziziphus jujuba var. spinosa TaxID=714518 RepID=A0A978USE8_ZIZJJ|nr:hypothetical protein FEM48_Zijuj09G0102500 [Ziziphus jujuba var. spinosa]